MITSYAGGVKMVGLAGVKTHLSEDLTLVRYDITSRLFPYNRFFSPMSFLEGIAEIKTERALAGTGNTPNERSIDKALRYVNEDRIIPGVREHLEKKREYSQKTVEDLGKKLNELREQYGDKPRFWQRVEINFYTNNMNHSSRVLEVYEGLLRSLDESLEAYKKSEKGLWQITFANR